MKKLLIILCLFCLTTNQVIPEVLPHPAVKRVTKYFFRYDGLGNLIFPTTIPPTTLPTIPFGPLVIPYYAEYTDYYLDTTVSPWRYEPAGDYMGTYYGPPYFQP